MAAEIQIVSFSEVDTARQCLFKHELAYKQRWVSPTTGPALSRGTRWHSVLEAHYRTIQAWQVEQAERKKAGGKIVRITQDKDLAKAIHAAVLPYLRDPRTGQQTEEQELVEWMYQGYLEYYGLDPDWRILAVEHKGVVPLLDARGRPTRFHLKVKIDLIVQEYDTRNRYVVDNKSGKDLPSDKMLDIDDQFGLYLWAMRQLGKPAFGSLHNAARTQRNVSKPQTLESRHARKRLVRTDEELRMIALDAYRQMQHAWSLKEGTAPRSPNTDTCRWRCDYSEACLLGRKGRDTQQVLHVSGFRQDFTRH